MGEFGSHDPSVYILITFLIKEREKERIWKWKTVKDSNVRERESRHHQHSVMNGPIKSVQTTASVCHVCSSARLRIANLPQHIHKQTTLGKQPFPCQGRGKYTVLLKETHLTFTGSAKEAGDGLDSLRIACGNLSSGSIMRMIIV